MTTKIDLTNFNLKEVEIISERPKILIFDQNKITKIDNLFSQVQLQQLSFSKNQIIQINGLTNLVNLTVLNLSHNKIISIDGIKHLSNLTWLNLANNRIKTADHLEGNPQLKHLDLSDNLISKIPNISYLYKLKTFLLHGNRISTMDKIGSFLSKSIEILSLAENNIHDLTEICHLYTLNNLKQFSIKGNHCLTTADFDKGFDYRPFIINWCMDLKILDGEEVKEKEKLIAEWLYTQGKGRHFKPGQHFELVEYLTKDCAFTNLKNKSKLSNDLDNILNQRKQLSSRKSRLVTSSNQMSVNNENTYNSAMKKNNFSNTLEETDLTNSECSEMDNTLATNLSMLVSESSFLPIIQTNLKGLSPTPKRTVSPTILKKSYSIDSSDVPTLKFSKDNPKLYSTNCSRSILNYSVDKTCSDNVKDKQIATEPISTEKRNIAHPLEEQINNNSITRNINDFQIPIDHVIRIQAWWRSVLTRMKNPIVKRYLSNRESQRTKSHILFLQKQMQLYYESYDQQRKLNATQNQAIQFLLDQVKELSKWRENFELGNSVQNKFQSNNICHENVIHNSSMETDFSEKEHLLQKINNLEEQISSLQNSVQKLQQTIQIFDDSNSKLCLNSQNMSESLYSEEEDLNRVIYEVEKIYENGSRKKFENDSELENDDEKQTLKVQDLIVFDSTEMENSS